MPSIALYFATLVFLSFTIACEINHGCVHALKDEENNKSSVKTVKSEDGSVIDCVDIYKQPAFDHPLLRNHTIQMRPTAYPDGINMNTPAINITKVICPEGTIPILRTQPFETKLGRKSLNFEHPQVSGHEHAVVYLTGKYLGAHASINVWQPNVRTPAPAPEFSLSQIWVISDNSQNRATAEAGWMVFPAFFKDSQTRFFLYWTDDNYQQTGCYNLNCPGFVQTNKHFALGSVIKPVSTYKEKHLIYLLPYTR
ncbi:uncharacterized protein LOC122068981 [Macadamia integrifolia]|uniref:uncharacterized protein LOC122068981 n=1 Tax=Macadamia integrifolia TaxID=60698 RepID=UPI001C4F323D|nr:uncharacterized protein LOC122068981 [Macadamia integrifolia]